MKDPHGRGAASWLLPLAQACVAGRYIVLAVAFALVAAATLFIVSAFRIDSNLADLIDRDAPFRQHQLALLDAFPQSGDHLIAVIEGGTLDTRLAAARRFATAMRARPDLARDVFAPAVDPFFEHHALLYQTAEEAETTLDRLAEAQPLLGRLGADPRPGTLIELLAEALTRLDADDPARAIAETALGKLTPILAAAAGGEAHEIGWLELLGTTDGSAERVIVDVLPVADYSRAPPTGPTYAFARDLVAGIAAEIPDVVVKLTGNVALETEELETVVIGTERAGLLSLALVATVLALGLGSLGAITAILLTLIAGLVLTAAFGLLAVGTFTMISVAFAVLFIGLGVDFAIHVVLRAREEAGTDDGRAEATARGTARAGAALLLCAPTTAVAFFAFTPTAYVGLAQLGLVAGAGMLIALALSLTLLPALLATMGKPRPLPRLWLLALPARVRTVLALTVVALALLSLPSLTSVRFDADPLAIRAPTSPSVIAFRELLEDPTLSPYYAEALVDDPGAAATLKADLEALPAVGGIIDLETLIPSDQDLKLALLDDALFFLEVPDAVEPQPADAARLVAALRRLADATATGALRDASLALAARLERDPAFATTLAAHWFRHWRPALDRLRALLAPELVDRQSLPGHLVERFEADDGRLRLQIMPTAPLRTHDDRAAFVDALTPVVPNLAGDVVQMTGAAKLVVGAMLQASLLATLGVASLLALVLRNTHDVLAVLATMAIAAALTLGAMGVLGLDFNFANVVVLPLLLGFGVDAAVHVVMRWRETGRVDVLGTSSTPRAVLLSALTTMGSFGTLMLSPHQGTASMGTLLTIAITASLLATLIVLPAWLRTRVPDARAPR